MRLIDADALLKKLGMANECKDCPNCSGPFCGLSSELMEVCDEISNAPTVVEPKKYEPALAELLKTEKGAEILKKAQELGELFGAAIAERLERLEKEAEDETD
ncbi:MAG: hypothetical protein J6T17_06355 [Clostridia bacterium]|nr:hypothetical protein [Clostridia bacterium]